MANNKGLYNKYTVIDNKSGEPLVGNIFVLRPDKDVAALAALRTYADHTDNTELSNDLDSVMKELTIKYRQLELKVKGDSVLLPGRSIPFSTIRDSWIESIGSVMHNGVIVSKVEDINSDEIRVVLSVPESTVDEFYKSEVSVGFSMQGISTDSSH